MIKTRNPPGAGRLVFSTFDREEKTPQAGTDATAARIASPRLLCRRQCANRGAALAGCRLRPGNPISAMSCPRTCGTPGGCCDLYEQAVSQGLAMASEWGRLRFVAAAEHARIIGTKNPCGLFVRLVRGGLWHFATDDDEDGGKRPAQAAPAWEFLSAAGRRSKQGCGLGPELSDDARLVRAVREVAARAGLRGDPFPLLKREKPEWTRERWDQAVAELGG